MTDIWQAGDLWQNFDDWGGVVVPAYPGVAPARRSVTAYTPRKPYLKFWQSPSTFFRDAVRHLKSTITKESAFEKPYLDLEYPTMHLNLPYPDWPRGSRFKPGDVAPTKGELVTGSSCKYCIITCYGDRASEEADCPETYGWCHISVACTSDPQLGEANPGDVGWSVEGPVLRVEEDSMDGINIYADWDAVEADANDVKTASFVVTLTDGLGHVCKDEFELECPSTSCQNETISYTSLVMQTNETQDLSVANSTGASYSWAIASGGGSLSDDTGETTTYTPPSSNANCSSNPTIELSCNGNVIDSITLGITHSFVASRLAYSIFTTSSLEDLPDTYCNDESDWSIGEIPKATYDCIGRFLGNAGSNCGGSSCSGSLCRCNSGDGGFNYEDTIADWYNNSYCDPVDLEPVDERDATANAFGCCPEVFI